MDTNRIDLTRLLLARLERISADSFWAHRASGIRGALLRVVEQVEAGTDADASYVNYLIECGFDILDKTAREKIRNRINNDRSAPHERMDAGKTH
jgi:hypothetical protein